MGCPSFVVGPPVRLSACPPLAVPLLLRGLLVAVALRGVGLLRLLGRLLVALHVAFTLDGAVTLEGSVVAVVVVVPVDAVVVAIPLATIVTVVAIAAAVDLAPVGCHDPRPVGSPAERRLTVRRGRLPTRGDAIEPDPAHAARRVVAPRDPVRPLVPLRLGGHSREPKRRDRQGSHSKRHASSRKKCRAG